MFGLNTNLPSAEVFFLMAYNDFKDVLSWMKINHNIVFIFQIITLILSFNVMIKIVSNRSNKNIDKNLSGIIFYAYLIIMQCVYIFFVALLITDSENNLILLYRVFIVLSFVGILFNYILPQFIHSLYSINKKRNLIFLVFTLFTIIWSLVDLPIKLGDNYIFTYIPYSKFIVLNSLSVIYYLYFIIISFKKRRKTAGFIKHITTVVLLLFIISLVLVIYYSITYIPESHKVLIENKILGIVYDTVIFFIISVVFAAAHKKIFRRS